MKVILLQEVRGKGGEGDVIDVARGFANNYLLKEGFAIKATPGNLKQLEQRRNNIAKREEARIEKANETKALLEAAPVTITAKAGEEGHLFGSVTPQMIADALAAAKEIEIDRRRIDVGAGIRTVGDHTVEIDLYRDIKAELKVKVKDAAAAAKEAAEAEAAAQASAEAEDAVEVAEEAAEVIAEAAEEAVEEA